MDRRHGDLPVLPVNMKLHHAPSGSQNSMEAAGDIPKEIWVCQSGVVRMQKTLAKPSVATSQRFHLALNTSLQWS